jgi:protein DPCD
MPWEASNYKLDVDLKLDELIIRTVNKKYYKKFSIPDLKRLKIPLNPENLSIEHANNTLIISYNKPEEILKEERKTQLEIIRIKQEIKENPNKKYDSECKNQ